MWGGDAPVYSGREFASVAEGTLGTSLRYFTPVYDADGRQIGAIAVGILMDIIEDNLGQTRWMVLLGVLAGFTIGIPGAFLLAGRIKKILFGLEPEEIARLFEEKTRWFSLYVKVFWALTSICASRWSIRRRPGCSRLPASRMQS